MAANTKNVALFQNVRRVNMKLIDANGAAACDVTNGVYEALQHSPTANAYATLPLPYCGAVATGIYSLRLKDSLSGLPITIGQDATIRRGPDGSWSVQYDPKYVAFWQQFSDQMPSNDVGIVFNNDFSNDNCFYNGIAY